MARKTRVLHVGVECHAQDYKQWKPLSSRHRSFTLKEADLVMGAAEISVQACVLIVVLNKSKSSSWMLNFTSSNIQLAKRIPPGRIDSDHTNEYNT
jgi:hypothetical protein